MQNETGKKIDIKSLLPEELAGYIKEMGQPSFRSKQVFSWLSKGIRSFDEMTDVSKKLREDLDKRFYLTVPEAARKQVSKIDGTVKYLWRLNDGNCIESVIMRYNYGNTICVSSQVGCRMGCAFCASTLGGRIRDLAPSEILDQVVFSSLDSKLPISHIVLMGIGEPLDNFDSVIKFLKLVNTSDGVNIGMRKITLSTCCLPEKVDKLAEYNLQLTLTVSLHAPDDETRSRIMPVNKSCGVDRLFSVCRDYFSKTGRRVSFEYAMIRGVNDTKHHAELLASKLSGMGCHVNLIPLNDVAESPLKPSRPEDMEAFLKILQDRGINVTVRRRLGPDINASCGQLRRQAEM